MSDNACYQQPRWNSAKIRRKVLRLLLPRIARVMLVFPCAVTTAALLVLAILCAAQDGTSAKSPLSKAERDNIFKGDFAILTNIEAIPSNLKQSFAEITKEPVFALANPGQEYQATDVVNPKKRKLPSRRLIFAGRYGDKWFIHYERGGIGHYYAVVLLSADGGNRPQFLWGGVGFSGAQNLAELRRLVAGGKFTENTYY
jgi:hypothetical protein